MVMPSKEPKTNGAALRQQLRLFVNRMTQLIPALADLLVCRQDAVHARMIPPLKPARLLSYNRASRQVITNNHCFAGISFRPAHPAHAMQSFLVCADGWPDPRGNAGEDGERGRCAARPVISRWDMSDFFLEPTRQACDLDHGARRGRTMAGRRHGQKAGLGRRTRRERITNGRKNWGGQRDLYLCTGNDFMVTT
jgi:hypothetical protein